MFCCGVHQNEKLSMYCVECKEAVCERCIETDHSKHELSTLGRTASGLRQHYIATAKERVKKMKGSQIPHLLKDINEAKQKCDKKVNEASAILKEKYEAYCSYLKYIYQNMEHDLSAVKDSVFSKLERKEQCIAEIPAKLDEKLAGYRDTIHAMSDIEVIKTADDDFENLKIPLHILYMPECNILGQDESTLLYDTFANRAQMLNKRTDAEMIFKDSLVAIAVGFTSSITDAIISFQHERDQYERWSTMKLPEKQRNCFRMLLSMSDENFELFESAAYEKYYSLSSEELTGYWYTDGLISLLRKTMVTTLSPVLEDQSGNKKDAKVVLSAVLRLFKRQFLKAFPHSLSDIFWVFTMPGSWNDAGRLLLSKAVEEAGIHSQRFLITSEHEAAAFSCRYHLSSMESFSHQNKFASGNKFVLLSVDDFGADSTVFQVQKDRRILPLRHTHCGIWKILQAFKQLFISLVGEDCFLTFCNQNTIECQDLINDIQSKIFYNRKTGKVSLYVPVDIRPNQRRSEDIAGFLPTSKVQLFQDKFRFDEQFVQSLAEDSDKNIKDMLKEILEHKTSQFIETLCIVGRFGESLKDMILEAFPNTTIVIPDPSSR